MPLGSLLDADSPDGRAADGPSSEQILDALREERL